MIQFRDFVPRMLSAPAFFKSEVRRLKALG